MVVEKVVDVWVSFAPRLSLVSAENGDFAKFVKFLMKTEIRKMFKKALRKARNLSKSGQKSTPSLKDHPYIGFMLKNIFEKCPAPKVVENLDFDRYLGKWYKAYKSVNLNLLP